MFGAPSALLGHQDALHLLLTDTLAQVLVDHHALVLELFPELLVLIVAGAELKLLLNAEEVFQLMSKRGCRRFEGRYFGLLIGSSVKRVLINVSFTGHDSPDTSKDSIWSTA